MGHDIIAQNNSGEIVSSLRYTMWDGNSFEIYKLLDVIDYHGGVSGIGISKDFTRPQIERALRNYDEVRIRYRENKEFENYMRKEVRDFLNHCLDTIKEEKVVNIYFG